MTVTTDDILAAIRELGGKFSGMQGQMDGMQGQMDGMQRQMNGMQGDITALRGEVADMRQTFGERLSNVEGQLMQIGYRISDLNARLPVPVGYIPPTKPAAE